MLRAEAGPVATDQAPGPVGPGFVDTAEPIQRPISNLRASAPPRLRASLFFKTDALKTVRGSRPVSRVLSRTVIHLGRTSPCASSNLPGSPRGPRVAGEPACFPIWSCSEWGLPCREPLPAARCALTAPFHPCRRCPEAALGRYVFCGTFRRLAPPRRYLALCPVEPGLSSPAMKPERLSSRLPRTAIVLAGACAGARGDRGAAPSQAPLPSRRSRHSHGRPVVDAVPATRL
jgi:hypothetical protein